jgi:single-stranded-DNA-specific exonuclease
MKFRWSLAPPQPLLAGQVANALKLSPLLAQCLLNRGLSDPAVIGGFLEPRLKHLADPFLLPNMAVAVDRLFAALRDREPIVLFGDYDVDGVTATTLLLETLRPLGWPVDFYLPHRMDEGYGLGLDAVENCLNRFPGTRLLLAVDCGSTSTESIAGLRQRGIDVIVLDHHQVADPPPPATALINPHAQPPANGDSRAGTAAPFRELCSVGLAFKLAHALVKRGRELGLAGAAEFDLRPLLDLVALGTIADIVPLTGENRLLVAAGLERLRTTQRPGLVALKKVAQTPEDLGSYEVGFQLGPRLNAAGRLETAEEALQLLLARDPDQATELAHELDRRNRERQKIERAIVDEVLGGLQSRFDPERDRVIVEGQKPWHIGVVGIVASRVLQQYYRPTIILGGDGPELRGSGRSIAGFDLAAALRQCDDLLVRHGGHAMAAGISIIEANVDAFRLRLNELARLAIKPEQCQALLNLDAEVGLEEINWECLRGLDRLKPTGQGNPPVQFVARNLTHRRPLQRVGAEKQHVKMWVTDGLTTHEALWWGAGNDSLPVGRFDLAFVPQINRYNDQRSLQLKVLDWRAAQ